MDLSSYLLGFIRPQTYIAQIVMLIIGCLVLGFGIFLQLEAKSVYNPAEGIVTVITENVKYPFGTVKTLLIVH